MAKSSIFEEIFTKSVFFDKNDIFGGKILSSLTVGCCTVCAVITLIDSESRVPAAQFRLDLGDSETTDYTMPKLIEPDLHEIDEPVKLPVTR